MEASKKATQAPAIENAVQSGTISPSTPTEREKLLETAEANNDMKTWFVNELDSDQRSAALGFVDGTLLKVFLRVAAATPSSVASQPNVDPTTDCLSDTIDWLAKIELSDIEDAFGEVTGSSSEVAEKGGGTYVRSEEPASECINENPPSEVEKDGVLCGDDSAEVVAISANATSEGVDASSSALRIRGQGEATFESWRTVENASTSLGENSSSPLPVESSATEDAVGKFISGLRATFPSAFQFVKPDATPGLFPFVSIHSSHTASGEELVSHLDQLMNPLCGFGFLSKPFAKTWMDLLRLVSLKTETTSFPLYAVVLIRLYLSVHQAFQTSFQSNEEVPSEPKRSLPTGIDAELDEPVDVAVYASLYTPLRERLASLSGSEQVLEFSEVVRPLALCFQEFADGSASLADGFFMPLTMALQRLKGTEATFYDSMRMVDQAVKEAVCRLNGIILTERSNENVDSYEAELPPSLGATEVDIDEDEPAGSNPTGRKKVGKRKRRKKKKKPSPPGGQQTRQPHTRDANVQTDDKSAAVEGSAAILQEDGNDAQDPTPRYETEKATSVDMSNEATTSGENSNSSSDNDEHVAPNQNSGVGTTVQDDDDSSSSGPIAVLVSATSSFGNETHDDSQEPIDAPMSHVVNHEVEDDDDDDTWETVGRSRGNRRKNHVSNNFRSSSSTSGTHHGSQSGGSHGNGAKKSKTPRSKATRRRAEKSKVVRDILNSVLDSVDEEVRRRRRGRSWSEGAPTPSGNPWSDSSKSAQPASQRLSGTPQSKRTTMRDVLIGGLTTGGACQARAGTGTFSDRVRQGLESPGVKSKVVGRSPEGKGKNASPQKNAAASADQNTAPTLPETLSVPQRESGATRSDSSSGGSAEVVKQQRTKAEPGKEGNLSPPLPTLLSPGNANSATSSVASSLDAPHRGHLSTGSENDVGYHLLFVCERLTRDIATFMKARGQALDVRRQERAQVLAALQDTLSTIWPGLCNVEMYGSCATDLDLPSSDLDVVVRGLDHHVIKSPSPQPIDSQTQHQEKPSTERKEGKKNSKATDERNIATQPLSAPQSPAGMMYPPMSPNAERVVRLAMELEQQPWAVHVKAIPTASVPVIKILADPAKLSGDTQAGSGDWLLRQMAAPSESGAKNEGGDGLKPTKKNQTAMTHIPNAQSPHLWRGADVVNGLLKVDITFEGPEHGGIGSTEFSSKAVKEFSEESGVAADQTAFVQVLMVLKEMLAQRRLNEPFSGGMSSYALLLLLVSVVRERKIIRQELERVERQRRMVAAGGGSVPRVDIDSSALAASKEASTMRNGKSPPERKKQVIAQSSPKNDVKVKKSTAVDGPKGKSTMPAQAPRIVSNATLKTASSSWASIAKKSTVPTPTSNPESHKEDAFNHEVEEPKSAPPTRKVASFADAVAKGVKTTGTTINGMNPAKSVASDDKTNRKGNDVTRGRGNGPSPEKSNVKRKQQPLPKKLPSGPSTKADINKPGNGNKAQPTNESTFESNSLFPQSFHDVIEVLASGETTPGNLLMHFLLFYGQHFDSQSTAIDYSGTHERDANANNGYAISSSYMLRRSAGSFDPMTGMLTVDPIVVYDPLEGAEMNNVARSCFAWSSIRWVFAQSYMTLSTAVEMSAGYGHSPIGRSKNSPGAPASPQSAPASDSGWSVPFTTDAEGNITFDPNSPLLELLLSF